MTEIEKLLSDELIDTAWGNDLFGENSRRDVINKTVLKCASGYSSGSIATSIVRYLGLVKPKKWKLTKLGKKYLYTVFVK